MLDSASFIEARLKGAHTLLHSTHEYIKWQAPLDVEELDTEIVYKISAEALRVTVRLTQIIAWLMLQKAVLEGEMTQREFLSEEYRVLQGKQCLEEGAEHDDDLPPRLRELLKESRELYERILRLDKIVRINMDIENQRK